MIRNDGRWLEPLFSAYFIRERGCRMGLIEEMEKILDRKDAFKRYQKYKKKYRSDDYASRIDFEADDIDELKDDFNYNKEKWLSNITTQGGSVKGYRTVKIAGYDNLDFIKNLVKKGIFKAEDINTDQAGIYWSYSPKGSRVYWSDSGTAIKFTALIPLSSIDIEATLWISLINPREMELRLKPNTPLTITNIHSYYKGKDKAKIQKLLKGLKPIKVKATRHAVLAALRRIVNVQVS